MPHQRGLFLHLLSQNGGRKVLRAKLVGDYKEISFLETGRKQHRWIHSSSLRDFIIKTCASSSQNPKMVTGVEHEALSLAKVFFLAIDSGKGAISFL